MAEPIPPEVAPDHLAQLRGDWQATPMPLDPAVVVAAERACRAEGVPAGAPAGAPGLQGITPAHTLRVADARGEGIITLIFASPNGSATCLREIGDGVLLPGSGGSTSGGDAPLPLEPDEVRVTGSSSMGGAEMQSTVEGEVGANVAFVRIVVDGVPIDASVGGGWFTAWWPGEQAEFRVEGYDAAGTRIAEHEW